MDKLKSWGQIRFICPCQSEDEPCCFDLKKKGGLIFYQCKNPDCPNQFSSDVAIRILDHINKYIEENDTVTGFAYYFRIKEDSMRARYIKSIHITDNFDTLVIEVTNLTRQPQYRKS